MASQPEPALAGFVTSNGAEEIDLAKGRPVLIRKVELEVGPEHGAREMLVQGR
jgi:hypothetical protein